MDPCAAPAQANWMIRQHNMEDGDTIDAFLQQVRGAVPWPEWILRSRLLLRFSWAVRRAVGHRPGASAEPCVCVCDCGWCWTRAFVVVSYPQFMLWPVFPKKRARSRIGCAKL